MPPELFSDIHRLDEVFAGKCVAIVGSGPGVLGNEPGFVDGHDVVVRINNHKCGDRAGWRTDVHFSFYGGSIRKRREDLIAEGVTLCMCKCPDAKAFESPWHVARNKPNGIDFRYIYTNRARWWFCPTYVPALDDFLQSFYLLGNHVPTTGFAAILDVLRCEPKQVYLTGFDFFSSGVHNVDERWQPGDPSDPIGHVPAVELGWLRDNLQAHPISCDKRLAALLEGKPRAILDV